MIPLFRNLRQKVLAGNQFSKYMLYAIGEIVLVVIGILIALQVNTWNELRLQKQEEIKTLRSLHSEFRDNLAKFDENFGNQIIRDSIVKSLLKPEIVDAPFETLDSLIYYLGWNYKFNPSEGIYNTIINSGKIEIISNDSLKNALSNFNNFLVDFEEEEIGANNYGTNFLTPYLRSQLFYRYPFRNRTQAQLEFDAINYREVISSDRTRNEFLFYWSYLLVTLQEGEILRKEMTRIIRMIEDELKVL